MGNRRAAKAETGSPLPVVAPADLAADSIDVVAKGVVC
jgi:hypothetical protein